MGAADHAWVQELLGGERRISVRRMFGGAGFYAQGVMIALQAYGELFLKVDDLTRERFQAAAGRPFVYDGKGKPITMSYWTVPDAALDSPAAMRPWADLALQAALRAATRKAATTRRRP